jgi:hypothetical protein
MHKLRFTIREAGFIALLLMLGLLNFGWPIWSDLGLYVVPVNIVLVIILAIISKNENSA